MAWVGVALLAVAAAQAPGARRVRNSAREMKWDVDRKGTRYPAHEACDAAAKYEELCAPVDATCDEVTPVRTKHGLGNSLQTAYFRAAKAAFEKGCTVAVSEDRAGFRLQDWVEKPARVPTRLERDGCVTWPLTQPGPELAAYVATARGDRSRPTVAIHVRTGWVDTVRQAAAWRRLKCPAPDKRELRRRLAAGGRAAVDAGTMVVSKDGGRDGKTKNHLAKVAARVADDADAAYGARGWDLYVCADAPGVRAWVARALGARAREVRMLNGTIGHNYWAAGGGPGGARDSAADVEALADLILLGEADVVVHYRSNFPESAANRNLCGGLRLAIGGHPRHALASISHALEQGKTDLADASLLPSDTWPCTDLGATTVQQCACMYQAAYA